MQLGEFARDGRWTGPQDFGHIGEALFEPLGRLEEHQSGTYGFQLFKSGAPFARFGGQKASKKEAVGRQSGQGQCREWSRCPGDGMDRDALGQGLPHQFVTGVGNQRRAGIADQSDTGAPPQPGQQPGTFARRVVIVVGRQRLFDAEDRQEFRGHAGVFGGNQIGPGLRQSGAGAGNRRGAGKVTSRALPIGVAVT